MTHTSPFAHADQMVRALIFSDRYLRRRLVKSALMMTGTYALVMFLPMFMQSQLFGELDPDMANLAGYLAQTLGGGMTLFAFLWAAQQTENLARTVMGEQLALRSGEGKGGMRKHLATQTLLMLPLAAFFWWADFVGIAVMLASAPVWLVPLYWLTHIQPADLPPGSTAKEDAVPQNTRAVFAKMLGAPLLLGLATLAGLLMAGIGVLVTVPLAAGVLALLEGRMLRHQGVAMATTTIWRQRAFSPRWNLGPLRQLWSLGAPPIALAQSLQLVVSLLVLIPAVVLLWTHGSAGFTDERLLQATSMSLWTAPIALPILGLVSCLSAFVFQTQAIWFTRVQDELQEGTAIEGLLTRLETSQAA